MVYKMKESASTWRAANIMFGLMALIALLLAIFATHTAIGGTTHIVMLNTIRQNKPFSGLFFFTAKDLDDQYSYINLLDFSV